MSGSNTGGHSYTYNVYNIWDGMAVQGRVYKASPHYTWGSWHTDFVF